MEAYMIFIYGLLSAWFLISIGLMVRLYLKGVEKINLPIYDSIPSVFTTIGVLGTFLGIYFGLQEFKVEFITESIPNLLEGLKTAFTTSITGIILSLFFGKISQIVFRQVEKKFPPELTDELSALNQINENIILLGKRINENQQMIVKLEKVNNDKLININNVIEGKGNAGLMGQLSTLNQFQYKIEQLLNNQNKINENLHHAVTSDNENGIIFNIKTIKQDQNKFAIENQKQIEWIVHSMNKNNVLISKKFEEFSNLLAKNNTEALVRVMRNATEEFNKQMSSLINKLVQENFKELNTSVKNLNDWQKGNKEMINTLTNQFKKASQDFELNSKTLNEVSNNTKKLTNENSHLITLIKELERVMVNDKQFTDIVNKLTSTINTLDNNTKAFDQTTEKLNNWVKNQMKFSDSVSKLLVRLEQVERIKDINEVFWNNTKKQLNEGVSIIQKSSKTLSSDLENINAEFYERLNSTLQSLDTLIQRIISNYRR